MGTFTIQVSQPQTWTGAQTFEGLTINTNDLTITDVDVVLATGTGTKIGTATNQKLSFFNATPIVQEAHIADPTADSAALKVAVDAILADLALYGLQASS